MLVWATEFPIKGGSTTENLLHLSKKWISGSPHLTWALDMFNDEPVGEITSYTHGGQTVRIARAENGTDKWCGFQQQYIDNGIYEWAIEIVGYETPSQMMVSIQLHCDLLKAAPITPKPHKPYIVKQILSEIGGGIDGELPVSDKPTYLQEVEVDRAVKIIEGSLGNHLPIIYASAAWDNQPSIDPERLAKWASGMAHVVVEPSRFFSFALSRHVSQQNTYGGAISVYWPNGAGSQARLFPDRFTTPARLSSAVADLVRKALVNNRSTPECTWDYIRELISRTRIETLRASGSRELDEFISAFDEEIAAKEARITKAENEINRLHFELKRANDTIEAEKGGVLFPGKEKPFYAGEIQNAVIKALLRVRNQFVDDGRCSHIIEDLITTNELSKEETQITTEIKNALNSAKSLGKAGKKALEQIGFIFTEEGKHIKAVYHNDPRYTFTISRTGSDWRAMKNLVSNISNKLFK